MAEKTALVVIDMLNRYEHEDAEALVASVRNAVPAMRSLIERARMRDTSIVYVNDNYSDWSAGSDKLSKSALEGRQRALVEPILPPAGAAFVTKARHSIFYETPLDYLLRSQEIERLVLAGQVTEQCGSTRRSTPTCAITRSPCRVTRLLTSTPIWPARPYR